ncbi:MAG: hypothetical protein P0Y58_14390 [Candidatus Pseudomonas phytovorans]|uniref:Uncharacterized protein n=1 Tax=Candidatus Pseudomonas phytovorans TaxID=3121377 RepID=A0AAJ6B9W2_9PSED|nr:hypothetical protein [Pseudomonas sp.]WEK28099.1 MAG: hypothetical protein P0Y58_14390 [Pseudomonas sp.]
MPATTQPSLEDTRAAAWQPCNTGIPLNDKWSKAVRTFHVHDAITGEPLDGSPLSFTFGSDSTQDKWPALVRAKLGEHGLDAFLRLGTATSATGDINAEKTIDFWQLGKQVRVFIAGFEETDKTAIWSCASRSAIGSEATLAQTLEAFVQAPEGGAGERDVQCALHDKQSRRVIQQWTCTLDYNAGKDALSVRVKALADSIDATLQIQHIIHDSGKVLTSRNDKTQTAWTLKLPAALDLELTVRPVEPALSGAQARWVRCHAGIPLNDKYSAAERKLVVHDGYSGEPLPGSPLTFIFGDERTADKWPALVRKQLKNAGLDAYLRLGTEAESNGTIEADGKIDFWHVNRPLRIDLGGFLEADNAAPWSCALRDAKGAPVTLAQAMDTSIQAPTDGAGEQTALCTLLDKSTRHVVQQWCCELEHTAKPNLSARVEALAKSIHDNLHIRHAVHDLGKAPAAKGEQTAWTLALPAALELELTVSDARTSIAQVLDECVQPPEAGFGQRVIELILEDTTSKTVVKKWPCVLDYTDDEDSLLSRIDAVVDSVNTHAPILAKKNGSEDTVAAHKKDLSIWFMNTAGLKLTVRQAPTLSINLGFPGLAADAQDDDILPTMIGFEPASIGGGAHVWRSPGYLLADRDLAIGERLQAWVISEQDGHVVKSVAWTAEADTCNQNDWPKAFLEAINDAPDAADGSKVLSAGYLEQAGGLEVAKTGSPGSEAFNRLDAAAKMELNRLWCFGEDCRLFSNAPFKANQVIAARVPDVSSPTGTSIAIQVRDRTTQYLYETYLFSPTHTERSTGGAKALCAHINQSHSQNGMLRAGVLGADGVTVVPEDVKNALWIPQYSNLSVEVDALTWRKHRRVHASSLKAEDKIQLIVLDSLSGVHLPGSPFIYALKEKDTDPGQCFKAFAEALQESPLGKYVRAGSAASADALPIASDCMIWVMMLPIKVFMVGPLDSGEKSECALTSADGRLLTFGDLYKDYRSGLSVTLTERWSGRALTSCEWQADSTTTISEADWLKGLAAALTPLLDSASFMTWSETAQSIPSAVSSECTLWVPESADTTCIVRPWRAPEPCTPQAPPALHPTLVFLQDKLACEEAIVYAALYLNELKNSVDRIKFSHLTAWGGEVISDADVDKLDYCMRGAKFGVAAPWITRSAVVQRIENDALGHPYYNGLTYGDPHKAMESADLPALLASSIARSGQLPVPTDVWQMGLPRDHWVDCEACNEVRAVFTMRTHRYSNILISTVKKILNRRESGNYKFVFDGSNIATVIQALKTADLLSVDVNKIIKYFDTTATEEAEKAFADMDKKVFYDMGEDLPLPFYEKVYGFVKRERIARGCSWQQAEEFGMHAKHQTAEKFPNKAEAAKIAIPHMKAALLHVDSNLLEHLNRLLSHHEITSAIIQENLAKLKSALIQHPFVYACSLQLQLTADAYEKGIRVASSTSDFSPMALVQSALLPLRSTGRRTGGISVYVPQNVHLPKAFKLFSASYVSASNIARACALPLSIDPPIVGKPFSPKDTLCADYTATLGSEVYDISGAVENGVDPKTGLFHAHCPVGVIRGLEGKGPEIDLTLHYSATRANEGALGDGWAFRFSAYDNRQHRLTLSNGQTVTLTAENVSAAQGNKRLAINGITLTGANGSFDALNKITIVFPSGRSETLAKPDPHDGEEPSEHFKTLLVSKLGHIKANLSQWRKESGISSEHKADYEGKIKNIEKMQTDMNRKAFILVPVNIESPLGGKLTLAWAGSKGHVRLTSIADGNTTLLSASHEEPVAIGKYSSTFTVWPDSDEAYDVKLTIEDCLLTHLTHQGQLEATPVQSVVFGYQREPVLDRVLCSVVEQDGSLEVVSYVPEWRDWDINETAIPLSRVGRHTLVPGAGQQSISHAWRYEGHIDHLRDDGNTYSAICMQDNGDSKRAPFTRRTWMLKNGFLVQTQVIEELPGVARETTSMTYPDTVTAADPAVKYRLGTQPLSTTVLTEDLRPHRTSTGTALDQQDPPVKESN